MKFNLKEKMKEVDFKNSNIKIKDIDIKKFGIKSFRKINYKVVCIGLSVGFAVGIPLMMLDARKGRIEKMSIEKMINAEQVSSIMANNDLVQIGELITPQWNLDRAKDAYAFGDTERANDFMKVAAGGEITDPNVANEVVLTYFLNGQSYKSIEVGEKYIEKFSSDIGLHKSMIMAYLYNGAKGKAEGIINKLSENVNFNVNKIEPTEEFENLSQGDISYKFAELAEMNYLIDDRQKSLEYLEKAWAYNNDNYKIYDLLAKMATDNFTDTIKSISYREEAVKEQAKNDSFIKYNENMYKLWIAKIYTMSDETSQEAEYLINEYSTGLENLVNVKRMKATAYLLNGKVEEAVGIIEELSNTDGYDFSVHYTASIIYYLTQDYDKALEEAMKVVELNENYEDTYSILLPNIFKAKGEESKIAEYFEKSIEKNPISVSNLNYIADYYYRNNQFERASYYYKIAMVLSPNNGEVRYKAALAKIGAAEETEQKVAMEEITTDEGNPLIQSSYNEALELVSGSISLTSADPVAKYYRMASIVYMRLGKPKEAYSYIKKAYYLDEDDILTLNNAGVFHILLNNLDAEKENDNRVQKGWYNLFKANEGLNGDYNPEIIDVISTNYKIANEFKKKFIEADDDAVLELPKGFKLLY